MVGPEPTQPFDDGLHRDETPEVRERLIQALDPASMLV